jgi:hypothetical protein
MSVNGMGPAVRNPQLNLARRLRHLLLALLAHICEMVFEADLNTVVSWQNIRAILLDVRLTGPANRSDRDKDGRSEAEQPDHSASLGYSIAS